MKKTKISLVLNILIVMMVIFAVYAMMTGLEFMGHNVVMTTRHVSVFKFFTVDSNILVGIASLILSIYEIINIKNNKKIPIFVYLLKYMAVCSVTLTFLVTAVFLAPFSIFHYYDFYMNCNLFLHLIIPVTSIISFLLFEKCKISFKMSFLGIVPMAIYAVFYMIMVLPHITGEKVSYDYDFYGFLRGGFSTIFWVVPLMFISTYIISFILWFIHSRGKNE